jgi:hypothetical protein
MNTESKMGGLISLGGNLESPRYAKATDFPAVGPSGSAGESSGAGQLVKQTESQEGPMHTQDSGDQTPSVWGKADFPVMKNKGEGVGGSALSIKGSINCETGQMEPNSMMQTY